MNDKGQVGMASKPLPVLKPVKLAKAPKLPLKPVIALLNELSFMKPPPPKKKEIVDLPIAIKPAEIETDFYGFNFSYCVTLNLIN